MKKQILLPILLLFAVVSWAQEGAKLIQSSQTIQNEGFSIHVGPPMLGTTIGQTNRTNNPVDIRFPWDVLYLFDTFAEESFDVSKGYFGDKILISWILRANEDLVNNISISRRVYTGQLPSDNTGFIQIANVAPFSTEYEDEFVEGGVLYEYRLEANGIQNEFVRLQNFITGIGYRSPTAIVTGSVNFEGGNPVKDVVIRATSQGNTASTGTSLNIPSAERLIIAMGDIAITTAATLQAFFKPESPFIAGDAAMRLFSLSSSDAPIGTLPIHIDAQLLTATNELVVRVDGNDFVIKEFYPSGDLSASGDDILLPFSDFNTSFVHVSVVMQDGEVPILYINGRAMNPGYQNSVDLIAYPGFEIVTPTGVMSLKTAGNPTNWNVVNVGGQKNSFVDEIRIWKSALEEQTIRTDYRRFINGNNSNLLSYLRANEGVGQFAYDLSRTGFNYNNNHGELFPSFPVPTGSISWNKGNIPTNQQLGVLGVTNENGNYEITAIPYSGVGESFNITPLLGVHEFDPGQQLVFLGQGAEVVNSINFTDVSSFSFKGRVLYDSRGIFPTIAGDEVFNPDIDEVGYNQYEAAGVKYQKGEWWRNDNGTPGNSPSEKADDYLEHYATIFSEDVNIFIDGEIVLNENNIPVTTDNEGFFDISVPIGNHFISIGKLNHEFLFEGRFPANPLNLRDFFEDSNQPETFIDTTRLTLAGRLVGGSIESAKPLGFGSDNFQDYTYTDDQGVQQRFPLSSKNNIGVANLTLGYTPPIGNVTNETRINFSTNSTSGEYSITVLPLNYKLETALLINDNAGINASLLPAQEDVNLKTIPELIVPIVDLPDGNALQGEPYHLAKNVIYRSTPSLRVIGQTSERAIEIDIDNDDVLDLVSTEGFQFPIYRQFSPYLIDLKRFEEYTNYDKTPAEDTQDPIVDGELLVTNNLALENSESIEVDENDASLIHYRFKGGLPRISAPYTRTISINYRIQGIDYPAENVLTEGIIIGGAGDGSQTFLTAAPDIPDIILRDPPGSNSSATIESGESITIIKETSLGLSNNLAGSVNLSVGGTVTIGGGIAGPVINTETVNEVTQGIGLSTSSEDSESIQKTYTFSQAISTSSEPDFVGSQGDLYIGQSVNYAYGSYDDVFPSANEVSGVTDFQLTNNAMQTIHIGKQKSMYFSEEPSETFYVLSQKTILDVTIPELQLIIQGINNGSLVPEVDGIQTLKFYEQQIFLWRKTILENERSKYISLNSPSQYRTALLNDIQKETGIIDVAIATAQGELDDLIAALPSNPAADVAQFLIRQVTDRIALLQLKKSDLTDLLTLINGNFSENISFDSGVGDFTRTTGTTLAVSKSTSFTIETEASFEAQFGAELNDIGVTSTIEGQYSQSSNTTLGQDSESSTDISYTLNDSDPDNLLSLDVINLFNGNGPVFSTVGGRTSCPYEDAEKAIFYNPATYDADATIIEPLDDNTEVLLSIATQRVEVPFINVEVASVTNIPESQNAEFILLLENNSVTQSDADFVLKVDNTSNPNNAIINIDPNGTIVSVPYGVQTPYALTLTKSVSDVFTYDDIRIVLQSFCDGEDVSDDVLISATFVPACSSVNIATPLENWVYNRETAFNADGSSNPIQITLNSYNLAFDSFQKIDLEYRLSTAPNWNRIQTFYTTQAFFDDAASAGQDFISLIDSATSNYSFDIIEAALQGGQYEIRARTTCVNGTEFIGNPVIGTVDLTAPRRFNTPSPQDGILSSGDDIKVSFNEPIFYNSALSQISITGRTNQLPIDNSVSVRFDGINNTAFIEKPNLINGDLSLEFWMQNETTSTTATIIDQIEGLSVVINGANIEFTLDGETVSGGLPTDGLFHHYTFTYDAENGFMNMYRDDQLSQGPSNLGTLQFTNNNDLIIGGNSFIGNIHDLRLWSKSLTLTDAFANIRTNFIGNEKNLIGYWPMNEGRGTLANDKARFNHININSASWDIKPKGESYLFEAGQYQTLDNVNFIQLNDEMDATVSFWMKTGVSQEATLFSNGRGDGTDIIQPDGLTNKWAVNLAADGNLSFASEGINYPLTTQPVIDNEWHHIALQLNRNGSLVTTVDGNIVSSNASSSIGGFSGNLIWLGARGQTDPTGMVTLDRQYNGQLDEFRLWNTLRNVEQISRDQYQEIDPETIGLLLYARMNEPDPTTGDGPTYFHIFSNEAVITSEAVLHVGIVNYNTDTPPIKPEREVISFQVNRVINGDDMILDPVISDFASVEGQILDITVHRMFDAANNRQESPITWTAFINKNDVSWFTPNHNNNIVDVSKEEDKTTSFEITLVNQGGLNQPYEITNIPNWLSIENAEGTLAPSSTITLNASIDNDLTAGDYFEDLLLTTSFNFDQKIQVKLKVLAQNPNWDVNPNDYEFSMNIIGKIRIDGTFSQDAFDKIGAFIDGEARGSADLILNSDFQEHFVLLTVYSNTSFGDTINFRIWDASQGRVLPATISTNISEIFTENNVLGSLSQPKLFDNTGELYQQIPLNTGWSWVSFNVNDIEFQNINALTQSLSLETSDRITTSSSQGAFFELYNNDLSNPNNSGWSGSISTNGGISSSNMYKVFFANEQDLIVSGTPVDISTWTFDVKTNWNWLPYPYNRNHSVNEALALFDAKDGDVIKSQTQFAIYDPRNGWAGTLETLKPNEGYMLKATTPQELTSPTFLSKSSTLKKSLRTTDVTISNYAMFSNNMNAIVELPEGYNQVFVYDMHGQIKGRSNADENTNLAYVTIYGENKEPLKFFISNDDNKLKEAKNIVNYYSNSILGKTNAPVVLEIFNEFVTIHPNPFKNEFVIDFNISKKQNVILKLYDITDKLLLSKDESFSKGVNSYKMITQLPSGLYLLHIIMEDTTIVKKIIKE